MTRLCCPNYKLILSGVRQNEIIVNICHFCQGIWLGIEAREKLLGSE
jgi:Zn-finger nucleic acid-binding protein